MSLYYLNFGNFRYLRDEYNLTHYNFEVIAGRCYFVDPILKYMTSWAIIQKFQRLDYQILINFQTPDNEQTKPKEYLKKCLFIT